MVQGLRLTFVCVYVCLFLCLFCFVLFYPYERHNYGPVESLVFIRPSYRGNNFEHTRKLF